ARPSRPRPCGPPRPRPRTARAPRRWSGRGRRAPRATAPRRGRPAAGWWRPPPAGRPTRRRTPPRPGTPPGPPPGTATGRAACPTTPPVPGGDEQAGRAGDRDVGEPPLLPQVAFGARPVEGGEVVLLQAVQRREVGAVAAQHERQDARVGGPAGGVLRRRREDRALGGAAV